MDCDPDDEHQEASDRKGLPPGKAMPPLEGFMEDQNQSGENAYSAQMSAMTIATAASA